MTCKCCRRESPTCELSAYNGRCESCYVDRTLSVAVKGTLVTAQEAMRLSNQVLQECVKLRTESE